MSTKQTQFICGNCKGEMGILDDEFFNCWDCRNYKVTYKIDEKLNNTTVYENHECDHCGTDYVKVESEFYGGWRQEENLDLCVECEEKDKKEKARLAEIERQKTLARWKASREKNDVFPDKYVVPVVEMETDYSSANRGKIPVHKYKFLCGSTVDMDMLDLRTAKQGHFEGKACKVCKILANESKAKVLTQGEVADLFKMGIYDKESANGNYYSESVILENGIAGKLVHYSTTEAIRTVNGLVIANSECWSSGWAKCSIGWANVDLRLPLSTLRRDIDIDDLLNLEIVQNDAIKEVMLIKTGDIYILFGRDENDNSSYMAQLPHKAETVFEGLQSLKPKIVQQAFDKDLTVKRQGDIFFVPTDMEIVGQDNYVAKWYSLEKPIYGSFYTERFNDFVVKKFNIKYEFDKRWNDDDFYEKSRAVQKYIRENITNTHSRVPLYKLLVEFAKSNKASVIVKEERHNQIFDTNHITESLKKVGDKVFVKGKITHTNRQHTHLVLDDWHEVAQNLAVQTWQVNGAGRD